MEEQRIQGLNETTVARIAGRANRAAFFNFITPNKESKAIGCRDCNTGPLGICTGAILMMRPYRFEMSLTRMQRLTTTFAARLSIDFVKTFTGYSRNKVAKHRLRGHIQRTLIS